MRGKTRPYWTRIGISFRVVHALQTAWRTTSYQVHQERTSIVAESHPTHIQVGCPSCSRVLRIRPEYLHRNLLCNRCNHQFAPEASDILPSEPPPPSDNPSLDTIKLTLCCPGCLRNVRVRKRWLGRAVTCKHCEESFVAHEPEGYAWPDIESEESISPADESVSIQALKQPVGNLEDPNPAFDDLLSELNASSSSSTDAEPAAAPAHAHAHQPSADVAQVSHPESWPALPAADERPPLVTAEPEPETSPAQPPSHRRRLSLRPASRTPGPSR